MVKKTALRFQGNNSTWQTIEGALSQGKPVIVLLEDEAGTQLSEWQAALSVAGVQWVDNTTPDEHEVRTPFNLWARLAETHPTGTTLANHLRYGSPGPLDPACPLLPDPLAVYDAISRWLAQVANKPTVVVLRHIDQASQDCLEALAFVARAFRGEPLALVLAASGQLPPTVTEFLSGLEEQVGFIHATCSPRINTRSPNNAQPSNSLEQGIAYCRVGAIYEGKLELVKTLTQPREMHLFRSEETTAWQYLAMAALRQSEFQLAEATARHILDQTVADSTRHLARRILVAALHATQKAAELQFFRAEICRELKTEETTLTPQEKTWLRLDAALAGSLEDTKEQHASILDSILTSPEETVPLECSAAAHIWRAALHIADQRPELALGHQQAGLRLLESLGDYSRTVAVRSRLGATLLGLGHFPEAAKQSEHAAWQGLCAGIFLLAAENLALAASAHIALGNLERVKELLAIETQKEQRVWGGPQARLLRRRVESELALAERKPNVARMLVNAVLTELETLPVKQPDWIRRIACECAYLLGDIAVAEKHVDQALGYTRHGLRLAAGAAVEDRPLLLARGRTRLLNIGI